MGSWPAAPAARRSHHARRSRRRQGLLAGTEHLGAFTRREPRSTAKNPLHDLTDPGVLALHQDADTKDSPGSIDAQDSGQEHPQYSEHSSHQARPGGKARRTTMKVGVANGKQHQVSGIYRQSPAFLEPAASATFDVANSTRFSGFIVATPGGSACGRASTAGRWPLPHARRRTTPPTTRGSTPGHALPNLDIVPTDARRRCLCSFSTAFRCDSSRPCRNTCVGDRGRGILTNVLPSSF